MYLRVDFLRTVQKYLVGGFGMEEVEQIFIGKYTSY